MADTQPALRSRFRTAARSFGWCRRGAIAVELAFVAPVGIVLLMGVMEVSRAISHKMMLQAAARAGTNFGLIKPPKQGDLIPVTDAVRAGLPSHWQATGDSASAQITTAIQCQCEQTGAIACGAPCGAGERNQSFLRIDVSKQYVPLIKLPYWLPPVTLKNTSMVRLQ